MNTLKALAVASATLLITACATSATSDGSNDLLMQAEAPAETVVTETVTQSASADDPNARVCKNETVLGSRFKRRICATQAEWDLLEEQARQDVHRQQLNGRSFTPGN